MITIRDIRLFIIRHGYLLIAAAWLVTLAFLANNYWLYYSSPEGVQRSLEQSIQRREKAFDELAADTVLMQQLLNRDYDQSTLQDLTGPDKDFFLYVFNGSWQTFWTSDEIAFGAEVTGLPEGVYFRKLQSGYYEIIRRDLPGTPKGKNFVLGILPVKQSYYFTNPYLPNRFYQLPRISRHYFINTAGQGLPIRSMTGKLLFSLQYSPAAESSGPAWLSGILSAMAVICVLIFINLFAILLGKKSDPWWGFLFLGAFLVFTRYLSYVSSFPFAYEQFQLFDATIYASNQVLRSLGDLLIDVALAFWIVLYFRTQLSGKLKLPDRLSRGARYAGLLFLSLVIYFAGQLVADIIRGLVINSKISFDVTDFFSLTTYSIVGFVILGLLAFCYYFFSMIINDLMDQLSEEVNNLKYALLGIAGILWLCLQLLYTSQAYTVGLMIWTIVYFFIIDLSRQRLGRELHLKQFILWLLTLTVSFTALLVYYNNQREMENRKQLAIKISKQQDPTLEFNLNMINGSLSTDRQLISFIVTDAGHTRQNLYDHLMEDYFTNLQNKYDFVFYVFDDSGRVVGTQDTTTIRRLNYMIDMESDSTSVEGLFYHEVNFSHFSYVSRLTVYDTLSRQGIGFLYYSLKPKTIKQETLYPKLLMRSQDNQLETTRNKYSYAVYDNLRLAYNQNDYPFPLQLTMKSIPLDEFSFREEDGYSQLWYKPSKDKLVVVVKHSRNLLETITLFAWLFCIFLILIALFRIFNLLITARMRPDALKDMLNVSIRSRVHGIVIFIVVFAFIILGISTISFFINRYDKQHRDKLSSDISLLLTDVQGVFQDSVLAGEPDRLYAPVFQAKLRFGIQKVADMHGVDINLYDLDGNLRISTQSLIYDNGLLSTKMDPMAYYKLHYIRQVQVIQKEQIGNLQFLSSYVPVRDSKGETIAFLNQPYFASESDLKQEISNFLVTLINLNAFIFLLSGLLALLFTNSITRSFTLIAEKLQHINLSGSNEPIVWPHEDEIGRLVKEYNRMVVKLEESAQLLAKSEREGAWREMARQVAHEIKNPLTPMKLSLQHLQRAIDHNTRNIRPLAENVVQTLIEQIEHLSQIASDFSAFANITYANNEKVLLNDVLSSVTSLHQGYEGVDMDYIPPRRPYYVYADKTQLNRLFTNLIQNAMQAIPAIQQGRVRVEASGENGEVTVMVRDNGEGIAEEARSRIFVPNFTTKSSGTGLGLAICKNIAEQAHGRIWFETVTGEGTSFFVRLPLMGENGDNA